MKNSVLGAALVFCAGSAFAFDVDTHALAQARSLTLQDVKAVEYPTTDKAHYLTEKQIAFVRPGLDIASAPEDIEIAEDGTVSIVFSLTDDRGLPLDREGIFTPGPISTSFVLARIPDGLTEYRAYTVRTQTSPETGESAVQASSDSGGTYEELEQGVYRYTFGTQLPDDFDASVTHTVGIYGRRDLREFDLGRYVDNELVDFVPAGGEPMPRDVVTTESCNSCHDPLSFHGGQRQEMQLCVMCHYEGVIDPDTGNTVDMKVMTHKLHHGENLPSVQAGMPYFFVGFRQSVVDYSDVVYPQDIRNCESCHMEDAAMSESWLDNPTRESCGSCHDDVVWETGENHVGGPQISDMFCANCHVPEGELEFDASIKGAHLLPRKSTQLAGINFSWVGISNTGPGQNPTATFTLLTDMGDPIDAAELDTFRLALGGPTVDYTNVFREAANGATPTGNPGEYTYTFETPIPDDTFGSWTASVEIREGVVLNPGTTNEFEFTTSTFNNPTLTFAVTDAEPMARRQVVSDEKCQDCHALVEFHGGQRFDNDYCVVCHNPVDSDIDVRPEEELPPRSIDMRFMIHRIHTGEELTRDYTLYGFRGSVHNYNDVAYPGDLRNCEGCHVNDSEQLPSGGVVPVVATENEFFSPIPPDSAACLGCHDTLEAAAHASINIAPFGESCATCHGPDREFSVDRLHARTD